MNDQPTIQDRRNAYSVGFFEAQRHYGIDGNTDSNMALRIRKAQEYEDALVRDTQDQPTPEGDIMSCPNCNNVGNCVSHLSQPTPEQPDFIRIRTGGKTGLKSDNVMPMTVGEHERFHQPDNDKERDE